VNTPLGWAATRWHLSPRALRWATTAALLVSIVIVFTGGLVRVTGSGLGCPTWPTCDGSSIASTPELGIHGVIEFGNRMLTGLVIVAVGWAIIAARLQRPRERWITRLAWSQFWLVVANAIAGGITVLVGLNPWVVALHFVLAIALIATTTLTWHRVRESAELSSEPSTQRGAARTLAVGTLTLILVGTLVTGTGPHSGDSKDVPRMAFQWESVTWVHGVLGALVLALAAIILVRSRGGAREALVRRRTIAFLVAVVVQGLIGVIQALAGLPEYLVAVHVLGSALVWVGALRVLLDADPLLFVGASRASR
jgi:heme a synthase